MVTIAVADGEDLPDLFWLDMRNQPWDGSTGLTCVREWDGHGMAATQSHAFRFDDVPAVRHAWPGRALALAPLSVAYTACVFTAVVMGVIDVARAEARARLHGRAARMGAFEQVEWTRAVNECWLIDQAFAGNLAALEADQCPVPAADRQGGWRSQLFQKQPVRPVGARRPGPRLPASTLAARLRPSIRHVVDRLTIDAASAGKSLKWRSRTTVSVGVQIAMFSGFDPSLTSILSQSAP